MQQTFQEQTWDEANFALFYRQHASSILDYLRTQTRILEDAEDLLAEVFLAARQSPRIGHERVQGQYAWLRQVAHNKLVDFYRRVGQPRTIPLETAWSFADMDIAGNPEQALLKAETLKQLQASIQRLPTPQQELLKLRFSEGLRCPQIAIRMGKREGAIRTMLVRTLNTLRKMYYTNREEDR